MATIAIINDEGEIVHEICNAEEFDLTKQFAQAFLIQEIQSGLAKAQPEDE